MYSSIFPRKFIIAEILLFGNSGGVSVVANQCLGEFVQKLNCNQISFAGRPHLPDLHVPIDQPMSFCFSQAKSVDRSPITIQPHPQRLWRKRAKWTLTTEATVATHWGEEDGEQCNVGEQPCLVFVEISQQMSITETIHSVFVSKSSELVRYDCSPFRCFLLTTRCSSALFH